MRRLSAILALLMLLGTAAPLLACMTDGAMTPKENACCQAMQGKCGDMAAMGCCARKTHTDDHPQLKTSHQTLEISWLAIRFSGDRLASSLTAGVAGARPNEHSPPGILIRCSKPLRI